MEIVRRPAFVFGGKYRGRVSSPLRLPHHFLNQRRYQGQRDWGANLIGYNSQMPDECEICGRKPG